MRAVDRDRVGRGEVTELGEGVARVALGEADDEPLLLVDVGDATKIAVLTVQDSSFEVIVVGGGVKCAVS